MFEENKILFPGDFKDQSQFSPSCPAGLFNVEKHPYFTSIFNIHIGVWVKNKINILYP